jgi:inhibitor of cysteine peptidase
MVLAGCNNGEPAGDGIRKIGAADNGLTVALSVGEPLKLELDSNITTGYSWEITEHDQRLLKLADSGYAPSNTGKAPVAGGGGKQWWTFTALASGHTKLHLAYHRPWEKGVPPVEEFEVTVEITDK